MKEQFKCFRRDTSMLGFSKFQNLFRFNTRIYPQVSRDCIDEQILKIARNFIPVGRFV